MGAKKQKKKILKKGKVNLLDYYTRVRKSFFFLPFETFFFFIGEMKK